MTKGEYFTPLCDLTLFPEFDKVFIPQMIHFDLLNIRTFLYFQNRFIAFQLELLTWLLIHFWCNKSWLWFRFNTCHVAFGFLIFYYTINLSPWTLFQHSTSQYHFNIDELMPMSMQKNPKIRLNFHWMFIWSDIIAATDLDFGDKIIMLATFSLHL